jgi:hypothetical protein
MSARENDSSSDFRGSNKIANSAFNKLLPRALNAFNAF